MDPHTPFWDRKIFLQGAQRVRTGHGGPVQQAGISAVPARRDFLWTVRYMHFLTGKAEERLSFDIQRDMAARPKYDEPWRPA
ncbi:MAG: hypothetical protein R3D29_03895 [Nitratireductor sp.]